MKLLKEAVLDSPDKVRGAYYFPQWPAVHKAFNDAVTKAVTGKREDIGKVIGKEGFGRTVPVESRDLNGDRNPRSTEGSAESIPKVIGDEMPTGVGKGRVQHESQRVYEVRLSRAVLADKHVRRREAAEVKALKVPEVLDDHAADVQSRSFGSFSGVRATFRR